MVDLNPSIGGGGIGTHGDIGLVQNSEKFENLARIEGGYVVVYIRLIWGERKI